MNNARVASTRQEPPTTPATRSPAPSAHRRRVGRAARLTATAAAVVTTASAVLFGVDRVHTGQERDAAQAGLAQLQTQFRAVEQLAAAPDARGDAGARLYGATSFVLASHTLDRAVLLISDLPTPPAGRTYQAWLVGAGHLRSVGLVPQGTQGTPPLVFTGLQGVNEVGLTLEPAGGSARPTTAPVALCELP